jgi:sensor histidine kinase YesM
VIRQQEEKMQLKEQLMESRLQAFQAQLNPHFIFNSLSSIQHFITNDDKRSALTYLPKFARLLRQVLQNSMDTYIPLEEELAMIRSYIEMEQLRFDNKFDFTLEVQEGIHPDQIEIPGLLLQPYIENAIIHGLLHKEGKGLLKISITQEEEGLICTIRDNGIGREKSRVIKAKRTVNHKSYGMKKARERLELLNRHRPNHSEVKVEDLINNDGTADGTKVTIRIAPQ